MSLEQIKESAGGLLMLAAVVGMFGVGAMVSTPTAEAGTPAVQRAYSSSVVCPSSIAYRPDGGTGKASGKIECPEGYNSVRLETESATAVYIGACPNGAGGVGCMDETNYTTVGLKRSTSATNGAAFSADVLQGSLRCVNANTSDAGVTLAVMCGR